MLLSIVSAAVTAQKTAHDFSFKLIDGTEKSLVDFRGKKILVVNTASECGFTPQYEQLQQVQEAYGDKIVIIGFPANEFGKQEPGTNEEIASFCKANYGVTFLMAEKVVVEGDEIHPLFAWLCAQKNVEPDGPIRWNFEKFILDENGLLIARFRSGTSPAEEPVLKALGVL